MTTTNAGKNVKQQELPFIAGGKCKKVQTLRRTIWHFLPKLNIILPYDHNGDFTQIT